MHEILNYNKEIEMDKTFSLFLRVCLDITYFAETENLLLKSL